MSSVADEEIDALAQEIMSKIEHTSSKELAESDEIIRILHLTNAAWGTGTHVFYTRKNKVLVVEDDESWAKVRNRKH